jgi:predicted Co/Zn/Cd cation transporter (cation efflux family)
MAATGGCDEGLRSGSSPDEGFVMIGARAGSVGASVEQVALRRSILASVLLSILAIGWGLVANSQVILLDGASMTIGAVLSGVSLAVSRLMAIGPTTRFPFGLEALAPLAVGVQGLALLAVSGFAAVEAVRLLTHGGTNVAAGSVAGYALLSGLAALGLYR